MPRGTVVTGIIGGKSVVTALGVTSGWPGLGLVSRSAGVVVGAAPSIAPGAPGGAPMAKSSLGSRETMPSSTPTSLRP